jgi:ribonuclease P protein component
MKLRFKKINRVRKNRDFRMIYETGLSVANRYLVMHAVINPSARSRIGITAGKKIGGAVVRNRSKRRVRECCRLFNTVLPTGYDIIVACRKGVNDVSWMELEHLFKELGGRLTDRLQRKQRNT